MGGRTFPDFKSYCKTGRIITANHNHNWQKDRIRDQWYRIQSPETKPHIYCQMIFDKGGKIGQGGKTVLSTQGAGRTL